MSKEALLKTMEQIKEQYDSQLILLEDGNDGYVLENSDYINDQIDQENEPPQTNGVNHSKPPIVVSVQTANGKRAGKVILGIKKESDLRRSSATIKRIMDEFPMQQNQSQQQQQQQQQLYINQASPDKAESDAQFHNGNINKTGTTNINGFTNGNAKDQDEFRSETSDPAQRLLQLQALVVGGEQGKLNIYLFILSNLNNFILFLGDNEELKKKRIKKKKYAEDRKRLLAESLRNGDDEEFMLRVYDSVQEEVSYKTKIFEREREKCKFLENEVKDLQQEFEKEREDLLDTIRKNEKQIKLIVKILQKIQPIIPHDSNYYNLDKVQSVSIWNEELQDWTLPEYKREKLSLPTMTNETNGDIETIAINGVNTKNGFEYENYDNHTNNQVISNQVLLNSRRTTALLNETSAVRNGNTNGLNNLREPEIDRYRIKLENSQFNGSNYFKTKRQSELLGQTQATNGRPTLSPLSSNNSNGDTKGNRRF
jgi:hypothetical protein